MSLNKISLTTMSLLISFTLAGFCGANWIGNQTIAEQYGTPVTAVAAQFSWFLGGILAGNLLSLALFRRFKIKDVIITCYILVIGAAAAIHAQISFAVLSVALTVIGVACGVGVCASSTIITALWNEKQRGSILVAQDAFFNTGGMIFPFVVASLLAGNFLWSWGYLSVASVAVLILSLALFAQFQFVNEQQEQHADGTEWSTGLTVAGVGLLLVLICKFTPIIWLPIFLEEKFDITPDIAGGVISKIYFAGLVGSLLSTFVVLRLSIQSFIAAAVIVGCASVGFFALVPSMDWISVNAYVFGLAIAAVYHSFIAWGLSYIEKPDYRHITFMYLCGGVGGTIAPYASSKIVEWFSISAVFICCALLYGIVLLMMFGLHIHHRSGRAHNSSANHTELPQT